MSVLTAEELLEIGRWSVQHPHTDIENTPGLGEVIVKVCEERAVALACSVFVVEVAYPYEGREALWAGGSRDDAIAFADHIVAEAAGMIRWQVIVTLMRPLPVEYWSRERDDYDNWGPWTHGVNQ